MIGVDLGGTKILAGVVDSSGGVERTLEVATPTSSQSALVEALIDVVEELRTPDIAAAGFGIPTRVDQKTDLQEVLARTGRHVNYVEIAVEGPPHERHFTCAALIDGEEAGRGEGPTKKAAEQEAARQALASLENTEA